jgi:hypothetical protein
MRTITLARLARGGVALLATGAAALTLGVESASAAKNLLTNGSFETGNFTGWKATNPAQPEMCPRGRTSLWRVDKSPSSHFCFSGNFGCPKKISAVKGSHFADVTWDGGGAPTDATLGQTVSIPKAKRVKLSWSDNTCWNLTIATVTMARVEYLDILKHGTVLHSYRIQTLKPHTSGRTGWVNHTLNLSHYARQTVQIRFRLTIPENFSGPANFALDAVTLRAR